MLSSAPTKRHSNAIRPYMRAVYPYAISTIDHRDKPHEYCEKGSFSRVLRLFPLAFSFCKHPEQHR